MDELLPQDIDDLLQELEEDYGTEEPFPPEVEKLLQDLQSGSSYLAREDAADQLGNVGTSGRRIVQALVAAYQSDTIQWSVGQPPGRFAPQCIRSTCSNIQT